MKSINIVIMTSKINNDQQKGKADIHYNVYYQNNNHSEGCNYVHFYIAK